MSLLPFERSGRRRFAADGSRPAQSYSDVPRKRAELDPFELSNSQFASEFLKIWDHPSMRFSINPALFIARQSSISEQEARNPNLTPASIKRLHSLLYAYEPPVLEEDVFAPVFDRAIDLSQQDHRHDRVAALESIRTLYLWASSEPDAHIEPERLGRIIDAVMTDGATPPLGEAAVRRSHLRIVD